MKARALGALLLLGSIWGASYLFIKVAVQVFPPATLVGSRVFIAAMVSLAILRLRHIPLPSTRAAWTSFAVMGLFNAALPYSLITWGEVRVDSGLTAILIATAPIFTVIFAHFVLHDERLTTTIGAGILLGFVGVAILIGPDALAGATQNLWGDLAIILAAMSYGGSIVYARYKMRGYAPLAASTGQMLMASLIMIPLALIIDRPWTISLPSAQTLWPAVLSLLTLAVVGTSLAYLLYYWLIQNAGAVYASAVTYISPFASIVLGVVLLGEHVTAGDFVGFGLILVGLMLLNGYAGQIARRLVPASAGK